MSENQLAVGSGQSAGGGDARAEARRRGWPARRRRGRTPLTTTIRWHRTAERMPAYGVTVVVWMEALKLTARAHREAVAGAVDEWRICGRLTSGEMITAWADAPNGPLPAPDNGGEE